MIYLLPVVDGMPLGLEPVELNQPLMILGRKKSCEIRIVSRSVSKRHAAFFLTDGVVFLRDLASTNGTRVNNTRIVRAALLPRDRIRVGAVELELHYGPIPAEKLEQIREWNTSRPGKRKSDADNDDSEEFSSAGVKV